MKELATVIPDVKMLLDLTPEELGAKILFLLRRRSEATFHGSHLDGELWGGFPYPPAFKSQVELAITEAFAWLTAQGLIVPDSGSNGRSGWMRLSRRARKMESEADFASFNVGRLLPKEILHRKIADPIWGAFMRGEFDVAAFQAMKGVEVSVRTAAGLGNELIGIPLMRAAFAIEGGPLTDMTAERGEREGRQHFFAGAIASYKNPHSHRDVNLDDPYEALEIILLANHLLRIVDARAKVRAEGSE